MRLGMKAGREIFEARYRHYQQAGKKDKGRYFDEAAETTRLTRGHPVRVLSQYGKKQTGERWPRRKKREAAPVSEQKEWTMGFFFGR
jgi:hypothetical protein